MNIFESMCASLANLPTKMYIGTETECEVSLHCRYREECMVADDAISRCALELDKVRKEIFDLSWKEEELEEQSLHILAYENWFFRLPPIRKVVNYVREKRIPELGKVRAEMSELSKKVVDIRNQHQCILNYKDFFIPPLSCEKQAG